MLRQISETVRKYSMTKPGDEIVVALSGGADSVCLLLALCELSDELGIKVSALHVNHCLRGAESDRDEQFCRSLCEKLGTEFICGRFDVAALARETRQSTELAARDVRYRFFAEQSHGRKTATAHNANDNAETVIFNLTRGTGTKGISGIPPVRDSIIRPLINVTREQIEEYLREKGQDYVTDSTNLTDDYTRNTIRHNVIPVLEKINSSFFRTVSSDSDNFRTDNDFIEQETARAYEKCLTADLSLTGLSAFHPAVRRRCISRLLSESGTEVNSRRINDIEKICINGGKINLSGNIYAVSEDSTLKIIKITHPDTSEASEPVPLGYGTSIFRGKKITVTPLKYDGIPAKNRLDADRISGDAFLRGRMPGDRIKLAGNSFTSSVKKLFNSSVPLPERDRICFISDSKGPVFIEGFGVAERVAVTDATKNILEITVDCE